MLARRLLEREPLAYDAHFVFGSTEYLISRIPSPARDLARIPGVAGDRKKASHSCLIAAESGWCFREFARRTLVNLYVEEGRLAEALKSLGQLVEVFPTQSHAAHRLPKTPGAIAPHPKEVRPRQL
jgi:hypothetical protein